MQNEKWTIIMLGTRYGSEDGYIVERYESGKEYDVTPRLASSFIARGYARPKEGSQ